MTTRLQSASSINTYNQCPRKYYYSYKTEIPKTETIYTLTGKAVHGSLEKFFELPTTVLTQENYRQILQHHLLNLFNESWTKSLTELLKLENDKELIRKFYQESMYMLNNFINDYFELLETFIQKYGFEEALQKAKPQTEVFLQSEKYNVRGYVDAILEIDNEVYIIDYKTNQRDKMSEDYSLQLGIYAIMYEEKFGKLPNKALLHFLRQGTKKYLEIKPEIIEKAKRECTIIKEKTESDNIKEYDKNPGFYCKWKTGKCSYYDLCFLGKKIEDFIPINKQKEEANIIPE